MLKSFGYTNKLFDARSAPADMIFGKDSERRLVDIAAPSLNQAEAEVNESAAFGRASLSRDQVHNVRDATCEQCVDLQCDGSIARKIGRLQRDSRSEKSDQCTPRQFAELGHQADDSPDSPPPAKRIRFPTGTGTYSVTSGAQVFAGLSF
jgi:hypothetical protein